VRSNRGGLTIVADPVQALYGDAQLNGWTGETIVEDKLRRTYRSTRSILRAAVDSSGVGELPGEMAEGRPVQLVWAQRWDDQASFVGWEIQNLVASGDYRLRDIGLLYTQRVGCVNRLRAMLDSDHVPYYWVNEDGSSKRSMPDFDAVRLLTVHAAKGLEFPVVFLFGLEALRLENADAATALRFARVGYVGMTRAQDLLTITYTRPNRIIEQLRSCDDVEQWTWPDDYHSD
jgi:superfamily I DNA/RNA helicase